VREAAGKTGATLSGRPSRTIVKKSQALPYCGCMPGDAISRLSVRERGGPSGVRLRNHRNPLVRPGGSAESLRILREPGIRSQRLEYRVSY